MNAHKCVLLAIIFILFIRKVAANAVFKFTINLRKLTNLEWLKVIPLLDFLNEYSRPFERPETNPQEICWMGVREKDLQLYELQGKAQPGYVYFEIYHLEVYFHFVIPPPPSQEFWMHNSLKNFGRSSLLILYCFKPSSISPLNRMFLSC